MKEPLLTTMLLDINVIRISFDTRNICLGMVRMKRCCA